MVATRFAKLPEAAGTPLGSEVYRGLTSQPKRLSPWLFYDSAGSQLFEAITELPEYYLTRTERAIFSEYAIEIVDSAANGKRLEILELGAGTAAKTGLLLKAASERQGRLAYRAIDVSSSALADAKRMLAENLPQVAVETLVADYTVELPGIRESIRDDGIRRLALYIGSSIGNFDPAEAAALLGRLRSQLRAGDCLLLGVDMVKPCHALMAAYNDSMGITAAFNKNALIRINRELDGAFKPQLFRHKAIWNPGQSRMEMHLESLIAQEVPIGALGLKIRFRRGETIHTENSYKFTDERVSSLLHQSGFRLRRRWSDGQGWFGVYLAAADRAGG